jgi:uncharacterized membrane protein
MCMYSFTKQGVLPTATPTKFSQKTRNNELSSKSSNTFFALRIVSWVLYVTANSQHFIFFLLLVITHTPGGS